MRKIIRVEIETEAEDDIIKAGLRWRLRNFKIINIEIEKIENANGQAKI